ncbi:MAG: hypothetical protein ABI868_20435 [Acidobacteriota bacterium]
MVSIVMAGQRRLHPQLGPLPTQSFPGLNDWLRFIAEDMDAIGELAVVVDQHKAQGATPSAATVRSAAGSSRRRRLE